LAALAPVVQIQKARRRFLMKRSPLLISALAFSILASGKAAAQDPVKVAPDVYTLKFENERVRVLEIVVKPGAKIAKHSHPDHFAYAITGGKLTITAGDKAPTVAEVKPGDVLWIPAETHSSENTGTTEIRALVTELKEPAPAKPAAEKKK
jgi:quercetin dioxygenase-like cupin family protein